MKRSGAQIDQVLQEIDDVAAQPGNDQVAGAVEQARSVDQRQESSQQGKQARKKRGQAAVAVAVAAQAQTAANKRSVDRLASDVSAGKARARLAPGTAGSASGPPAKAGGAG